MPITAPDQHVPDAASRPGSARDLTHYHRVAPVKFVVLSFCTLGLYEAYWFYRSWRFVQERDDRRILPFARAVFSPLWYYALVQDVNRAQVASGTAMAALGLALAYGVLAVAWRLPEPWWLISLATFVPLLPVVRRIDTINHALGVAPSRSRRFGLGHVSVCVVGGTFVLFSVLSALLVLPSSEVVAGSRLPQRVVRFLRAEAGLLRSETVIYFYGGGLLSYREDGNVVTDQGVISYFSEDGELFVAAADYADIVDVRVTWARSVLDDTLVEIHTGEDEWFVLVASRERRRDRLFVDEIQRRWRAARELPTEVPLARSVTSVGEAVDRRACRVPGPAGSTAA